MIIIGKGSQAKVIASQYSPTTKILLYPRKKGLKGVRMKFKRLSTWHTHFMVGIGRSDKRKAVYDYIIQNKLSEPYEHPSNMRNIGKGTFIGSGVITIGIDTIVGDNVLINTGVIIEHDCKIGNHATIGPGAILCGKVEVGEGAFIGAGAIIGPKVKIKPWEVISAGERVLRKDRK